ncbi:unnamed protein product, partial [Effrenium voratum]
MDMSALASALLEASNNQEAEFRREMDRLEGDVHGSSADEDSDGSATKAEGRREKAPAPPEETGDVEPMEIEEGAGIKPAPPDLSGFDEEEDAVEESKAEK